MASERYPGERRGLGLFLEDLREAAVQVCGPDALLVHAIRRALRSHDLHHLRHARTLFNHLPREQRLLLSAACVVRGSEPAPRKHELLERYSAREPAPFVAFESTGEPTPERAAVVRLTHELLPAGAVQVLVSPGTLPASAAGELRRIADLIEGDRRLLSARYWRERGQQPTDDDAAQTPKSSS